MKFDSGQITVVIAIAAIVSPVIVAIINDIFTYRLKKNEFELNLSKAKEEKEMKHQETIAQLQIQRRNLIANFVSSANRCYLCIQVEDYVSFVDAKKVFAEVTSNLMVVSSPKEQKQLLNWLNLSQSPEKSEWKDLVAEINHEAPNLLKRIN